MNKVSFLIASLTGAGLMYLLDPKTGRRRRSLLRDQLVKLSNTLSDQAEMLAEQTADRTRGVAAETMRQFSPDDVSDETLVARVRAEMGRYVSHPGAVEVTARMGVVTLTGHILAKEMQPFVGAVQAVLGVRRVENNLQVHEDAGNIPDLQGGKTRTEML